MCPLSCARRMIAVFSARFSSPGSALASRDARRDLKRSRMFLSGAGLFFCFPGVARVGVICKVSVAISLEKGVIIMITPWREQLPDCAVSLVQCPVKCPQTEDIWRSTDDLHRVARDSALSASGTSPIVLEVQVKD